MRRSQTFASFVMGLLMAGPACWAGISPLERGAKVETDSFAIEIRDGVVVGLLNKLTSEEYLDRHADLAKVVPHLPAGLGTQATEPERVASLRLYQWPWWEHPADASWPNHHAPSPQSKCELKAAGESKATLTYTGLSDGEKTYPDESLTLELAVDAPTGDLLITPVARSPRAGVYSSSLTVAPLGPAITAEAPIFDGVRLDRHTPPALWVTQWGGYWDYAFLAFNGYKKGAVAVWCQDADLKHYKSLNYLTNREGISFSFTAFNVPPFDQAREAGPITWRIQAFSHGWSQAVARYRDWRTKNVKTAPRPEWASQISFVNGGVNAEKEWRGFLEKYLGANDPSRAITLAGGVRTNPFNSNHINNTAYKTFPEDMKAWKAKGHRLMALLQPMLMESPDPRTDREKAGMAAQAKSETVTVFQKPGEAKPIPYLDLHHLGQGDWQRWMLDWVKEYIQDYGADGIYHDNAFPCPIDVRGLAVDGKTSPQGMAEYFLKAQSENPNSIHCTQHLTEINVTGASLGVGSSVVWGTAQSMRRQRVDHPSPISNALHFPLGAIFSYPHYSGVAGGPTERFHWGMNLAEGRGELAFALLQNAQAAQTDGLAGERWLETTRNQTFLRKGLRAVFPEEWDRQVLSYFRGAKGEDLRYVITPWGSAFVEIEGGKSRMISGRIHGVPGARTEGGIHGWPVYNASGPSGLHPGRYYVLDPDHKRPVGYFSTNSPFSTSLYEGYVEEGLATETFAYIKIRPREDILNITSFDSVTLHTARAPKAVWVDGVEVKPQPQGEGEWKIEFQLTARVAIVAILNDIPAGIDKLAANAVARSVGPDWPMDQLQLANGAEGCKITADTITSDRSLVQIPIQVSPSQGDGTLKLTVPAQVRVEYNAMEMEGRSIAATPRKWLDEQGLVSGVSIVSIPMRIGEQGVVSIRNTGTGKLAVKYEWVVR